MKKLLLLFGLLLLSGCYEQKFRCENGVVYLEHNGAWIEAKIYEKNKCLPEEGKK